MPNSTKLGHYLSAIVRTILNMPKQTQLRWGQNGVRESKHILSLQNFRWRNHYPRLSNNSCISSLSNMQSFVLFSAYVSKISHQWVVASKIRNSRFWLVCRESYFRYRLYLGILTATFQTEHSHHSASKISPVLSCADQHCFHWLRQKDSAFSSAPQRAFQLYEESKHSAVSQRYHCLHFCKEAIGW